MDKKTQINIWYIFLAIFGVVLLRDLWVESQTIEAIPYSQFETYLDNGQIEEIVVGSDTIRGTFKSPQDGKTGFVTTTVPPDMAARLEGHEVTFTGAVENTWLTTLLSWVLPALVFVGIWVFFIRKLAEKQGMGMGGFMSIGKSKAKIYVESDTKVSFDDVAGVDEAKQELEEIVEFLKDPEHYGGHDEREQTLNQLLTELDGFDPSEGVVLLAATNRPEILDPALLRAGRFDRQVLVDRPDRAGRVQILKVHMKKIKVADSVDPDQIAALTTGFSGADLANLVNEAAKARM